MSPMGRLAFMLRRIGPILAASLTLAAVAHAQSGQGHRHGGRQPPSGDSAPAQAQATTPAQRPTPVEDHDIVGVVKALDPAANRITIAYEAVAARNWPPGTMPFVVSRPSLLASVSVGERVRFRLDSEQITDLRPF